MPRASANLTLGDKNQKQTFGKMSLAKFKFKMEQKSFGDSRKRRSSKQKGQIGR
jgi:hypothetical protein